MRRFGFLAALVAMLALPIAAQASCDKNFVIHNSADLQIVKFYVSPTQVDNWEDNVLNHGAIDPDMTRRINMADDDRDYSMYDVKAVFSDGSSQTGTEINLCRATDIYVYGDRVTFVNAE